MRTKIDLCEPPEDNSENNDDARATSQLAEDLNELKRTVVRLCEERERLPQPMFWSLLRSRLTNIRKAKALQRILDEKLGG